MGSPDMTAYRALVEGVMRDVILGSDAAPRVFENTGKEHARIVLDVMLANAQSSIDIYSECMNREAFDPQRIRDFFARCPGGQVRILVERGDVFQSKESALSDLSDLIGHEGFHIQRSSNPSQSHVAIIDGQHVRIEQSHEARRAIVAFGQKELAQAARKIFEVLWPHGQPLRNLVYA
jgi:hypothetical protein